MKGQADESRFISDIASFELKPLFLVGSTLTALCFVVTVAAVHVMRYEPGFALLKEGDGHREDEHGDEHTIDTPSTSATPNTEDTATANANTNTNTVVENETTETEDSDEDTNTTKTLRLISLLSILAAATASTALILLSVMDTFRYHSLHHLFLQICFSGLALQAAGTAVVYANEVVGFVSFLYHGGRWLHDWGRRSVTVRILCVSPFPFSPRSWDVGCRADGLVPRYLLQ